MLRLVEILMIAAPIGFFLAWRLLAPSRELTRAMVGAAVLLVLVLAGSLLWLRWEAAEPADAAYVPSRLRDGRVLPPDAAPR